MSIKDINLVNPYNKEDMLLIKNYDKNLFDKLQRLVATVSEDDYKTREELDVENVKYFYTLKDDEINDFITAVITKDNKIAKIYPVLKSKGKKFVEVISNYLLDDNDMEEVFVLIKKKDIKVADSLIDDKFISLKTNEDEEYIPLLKEKKDYKESSVSWKY